MMMQNGEDKYKRDLEEEIKSRVHDRTWEKRQRRLNRMNNRSPYGGLIPGGIILAIGTVFLLSNLGYGEARRLLDFWPVFLIFAGVVKLFDPCRRAWGVLLIFFGAFLLMNQLGIRHFAWGEFWPLILIAVGTMAMWSAIQARKLTQGLPENEASDPRTTLNESAVFGGIQKRLNGKEFRGGQLQAMFGGIEIDMRDADIAENEAVLYANSVFGGIELRVPETWYVAARGQGIFGGFTDSTRYTGPVDPDKPKKTLIVLGMAVFGGVEIRN
jgi:predicted membrane protein